MSYRRKHIHPKIRSLKPKKKFWQNPLFWIIFGLLITTIILYLILFYPKFQIKNIEISGNEKVKSEDIQNTASENLNKKILTFKIFNIESHSIFITDANNLLKSLLNTFPKIENVNIQKKFPNSIILTIKERQPFAIFCQNADNCFLIDKNGIIFEQLSRDLRSLDATQSTSKDMMVITKEQIDANTFTGKDVIDKNIMDIIDKVERNLKNNFQIDIKEVLVANPLVFKTSENWQIYFEATQDIDPQIIKMNALLKNEITKDDRKKLQYIYLQYKDRAYYK